MPYDHQESVSLKIGTAFDRESASAAKNEFGGFIEDIFQEVNKIKAVTQREFSEFVQGTAKDASETWDKTTKEMNSITGKSLWGSVKALFQDDMDQVEDIWDNAWNSMIGSADKAWDGLVRKAARRLQCLRHKSKGPEVFSGALAFG